MIERADSDLFTVHIPILYSADVFPELIKGAFEEMGHFVKSDAVYPSRLEVHLKRQPG